MRRLPLARSLLAIAGGWLLVQACGSRTGLPPGRVLTAAGSSGLDAGLDAPPDAPPVCLQAADCPQPPPGQCGSAACTEGVCSLDLGQICDDGQPCTVDSCTARGCVFTDGHVDADGDGAFARGTLADPNAAVGCGDDCDDSNPDIFPGAVELCDSVDNDCNGVVDDGTTLSVTSSAPVRVSPLDAEQATATGLAFDGESFGAGMTSLFGRYQGQFRQLDLNGNPLGDAQRLARVNAESYGASLAWSGERYLAAYEDARQDGNYEVYFDLLNRKGQRLIEDLRVTNADDFSIRPSVAWTGAEALLVWDDWRFGDPVIYGQRVSSDGQLQGGNTRLSEPGVWAESSSIAVSDTGVGIAFVSLVEGDETRLKFMTTSRTLEQPSALTTIDFADPDGPVVTVLRDKYVITFHQESAVIGPAIFGVVMGPNGIEFGPQSITAGARHARGHATYSYGDRFVMVWSDDRDGKYQLYAQTFDGKLAPISARLRVTNTGTNTLGPVLAAASDGGVGILYTDEVYVTENTSEKQVFFSRLDCRPRP